MVQDNGENRLVLLVEKKEAGRALDFIVSRPELRIEDFAVKPPSLEDVYFHIDAGAEKGGAAV
ncbi:hypothetical protein [Paenibacillus sp. yr247]|uniref:hypothetical protein n=1 Tax=Paenibacillus sp. yr247 TaxID=1761880 RepID=UPI0034A57403